MTQFTYRLLPLLEQKEELKKEADRDVSRREQELQTQLATLESLQQRVQGLVEKRQHARQELMTKSGDAGALTAADVLKRSEFIKVLGTEIREAENDVSAQRVVIETCESDVKEAKELAAEAQREVEVLNKHREKQEQRFRREEEAKEEVALDEIGKRFVLDPEASDMRIDDSQPSSSDQAVKSSDRDKSSTDQNKDSSFSKVLAKKRDGKQDDADSKTGKQKETDPGLIPGLLAGPQALLEQSMQPTAVQSKSPVQVPPELQGLVREISSLVNVKGNQQVNIELNSNVLKGLHIQIERQKDGAIAIQFQSSSEAVTNLLSKNMDALSQGLIDRGVNVGDIRVSGRDSATGTQSSAQSTKTRSTFGGANYPAGRQGGRR